MSVLLTLNSQNRVLLKNDARNKCSKIDYARQKAELNPDQTIGYNPGLKSPIALTEDNVGETRFDKQGNYIVANRFWRYDDGRMNFVWTMGYNETTFPDRGTGYNKFDGTSWDPIPAFRIENTKTGWPSYAPLGLDGEIIATHLPDRLRISSRSTYVTGEWTTQDLLGQTQAPKLTSPTVITSGADHQNVHMICNTYDAYQGMEQAMLYWRSTDGGATWDIQNQLIPGVGPEYYYNFTTDGYAMAVEGNTIAILAGSAWHDLILLKSTDNGDSWNKTVIWEHPYPFFDFEVTLTDTFYCVDGGIALALDKNGMAHVSFGISRALHETVGTTFSHFYLVDGIGYWNETRPTFSNNKKALCPYTDPESEMVLDYNLIGFSPDLNNNGEYDFVGQPTVYGSMGLSGMPAIHVDQNNTVFIAYSTTTEGFNNGALDYKHVWVRTSPDLGTSWGEIYDMMDNIVHIFVEGIMRQFPNTSDNENLYMALNLDSEPGTAIDGDHSYVDNFQNIIKIVKDDVVGVNQQPNKNNFSFELFPNPVPATALLNAKVLLNEPKQIGLKLIDITGKTVYTKDFGTLSIGGHKLTADLKGTASGTYLCSIQIGTEIITKRLAIF